ncbi:hypothetical protein [Devosia sp. 2618]|uniref:hypothetical protein n=1 Tax=Devosia sp. 2618 TaxID=3156454 RepID=UPI0033926E6C
MADTNALTGPNWIQRNWVICLALLLTAAWAMGAYLMLQASSPCKVEGQLAGFLECRTSNEIGDLLAGLFSPVAFVWLVAAVLMQSGELRAQREELQLTRKEYSLTRSEVEAQRLAMEQQVLFVEQQTAILMANRAQESAEATDDRIEGLAKMLVQKIGQIANARIMSTKEAVKSQFSSGKQSMRFEAPGSDPFQIAQSMSAAIQPEIHRYQEYYGDLPQNVEISPTLIADLINLASKIDSLADSATAQMQDKLTYFGWGGYSSNLNILVEYIGEKDQLWPDALAAALQEIELP